MSGDVLGAWLAARRPEPPAGLARWLRAAVARGDADAPADPPAARLAALGVALVDRVARAPAGGRELAADLLAADAMVTYAFEAQAEANPDGLAALADQVARRAGGA